MSKLKKTIIIIFALVVLITAGIVYVVLQMEENFEYLMMTEIEPLALEGVEDGHYIGEYDRFPLKVVVDVEVVDHQITSIVIIEHDNGQGSAAEVIIDDVMTNQSLDIDAIAGATYSSKAILLAISEAFS